MSIEIKSACKNFTATRFMSGVEKALCLQITGLDKMSGNRHEFIQVSRKDALELAQTLIEFANGNEIEDE